VSARAGESLTPLEIASGLVFGIDEPTERARRPGPPLTALEEVVLPALNRPPCLVSFSGGRDSSCVLGLAASVARREGLPDPVPVTLRFPQIPEADERVWQERVVSGLGLRDWVRLERGDDLDAVGPIATDVLRRFGLLWPFNAYVHAPMLEAARGGSLLTGFGGDEHLQHMRLDRAHAVLGRRARPVPRDALRLGLAIAPWRMRKVVLRRRGGLSLPWLLPPARRAVDEAWATDAAREPLRVLERADWWTRRRGLRVAVRSLGLLAAAEDALIAHPFAARAFATAVLSDRALAHADRAGRLAAIFGDMLPAEVYARRSKASFNRAFFGRHARALVARWDGEAVDANLVDAAALRSVWEEDVPDGRTYLLLQAIALSRLTEATRATGSSPPPATTSDAGAGARMRATKRD
jgi:asparagine synthase (glutamine-hydrolysing)